MQRVGNFHATGAMEVILVYLANFFFPDVLNDGLLCNMITSQPRPAKGPSTAYNF